MIKSYGYKTMCLTGLLCYLLSSCISPFEPVGVKDTAGILVVEGLVLDGGTTVIKLSRTVKLDQQLSTTSVEVQHATVQLIDENNNVIAVAAQQVVNGVPVAGAYVINPISFASELKYALNIMVGDRHYRSAFVSSVHTPEIDEVRWELNEDETIDIKVSTHDPANQSNYFLWAFEEDWEIRSRLFGESRYDQQSGTIIEHSLSGPNNRYYCWASDRSKSLLLSSSDKLSESIISNKKIHQIQPRTTRLSYLYSILVKQYSLDKEAYGYFENLQRNVEEGGSLFAPQPSEKAGNIRCLSHPDEPVIGYIAITQETTYRLFIDAVPLDLGDRWGCDTNEFEEFAFVVLSNAYTQGLGIHFATAPNMYRCVSIRCVDCTVRGGTKNKPDFWPNDHQ